MDGHDRIRIIVFTPEQRPNLQLPELRAQRLDPRGDLRLDTRILFLLSELVERGEVFVPLGKTVDQLDVVLQARQLPEQRLGGVGVVPKIGDGGLLLELTELGALGFYVKDRPWRRLSPCPGPRAPKRSWQP